MNTETIKTVQTYLRLHGLYNGKIDGIDGVKTWDGVQRLIKEHSHMVGYEGGSNQIPDGKRALTALLDARSEGNIKTLLPEVHDVARAFINDLNSRGFIAKIISGTRTYEEQTKIYNQGRTTPGRIVTNAPAGYSNHNFGIAFDIGFFTKDGGYIEDGPPYDTAGPIGEAHGLSWGGRWKNQDKPHYEFKPKWAKDLSESQMVDELRVRKACNEPVFTA